VPHCVKVRMPKTLSSATVGMQRCPSMYEQWLAPSVQVVATDGVWEVMTCQEVAHFVQRWRKRPWDGWTASDALTLEAQERWKLLQPEVRIAAQPVPALLPLQLSLLFGEMVGACAPTCCPFSAAAGEHLKLSLCSPLPSLQPNNAFGVWWRPRPVLVLHPACRSMAHLSQEWPRFGRQKECSRLNWWSDVEDCSSYCRAL
jgi:hypothetical protein